MSVVLYGASLSPYVRKVRMALAYKKIEYQQVNVIPSSDDKPEEFVQNSPLGKIPLIHIDDLWLPDSSAILGYLERAYPEMLLLSNDPKLAARALWFEAYAATQMNSVIGGHLFAELILAPALFNRESNWEEIELARTKEIPEILDYLESQIEGDYLLGDTLGYADICVGSSFVTMHHCNENCDPEKWPKMAKYISRVLDHAVCQEVLVDEYAFLKMATKG